jgi:uncharacterized protein (TIGR00295 family)
MDRPTPEKSIQILKDAGCDDDVVTHCQVVSDLAVRIAERIEGANVELVRIGGLLHDLGRARTHELPHFIEGARLASELGLPEEVRLIIERHVGAGIVAEEAKENGLPERDYIPETLEQKIVAHADNMVDYHKPVPVSNVLQKLERQGKLDAVERIKKLHSELSKLAGIDLDELVLQ